MCFSANASFAAAATLLPTGGYGVWMARAKAQRRWLPTAFVPLAFGMQQLLEGFVWLSLHAGQTDSTRGWALGYLLFSHAFWPFFAPLAAYAAEERPSRRTLLFALTGVGLALGLLLYVPLLTQPGWFEPVIVHGHLDYSTVTVLGALPSRALYALTISLVPVLTSRAELRFLGILTAISIAVTFAFWSYAFISVWCFFAALLSAYNVYILRRLPDLRDQTEVRAAKTEAMRVTQ